MFRHMAPRSLTLVKISASRSSSRPYHCSKLVMCSKDKGTSKMVEEDFGLNRPRRIILLRHCESEGNVDERAYTLRPDSQIGLTARGMEQAVLTGQKVRDLIGDEGKIYVYVSPYLRALQTLLCVGKSLEMNRVAGVREEPRLREQDFGNLQARAMCLRSHLTWFPSELDEDVEEMARTKRERAAFGRFFFRFPNGESAADVFDRVTGFRDTLSNDMKNGVGRFRNAGMGNGTVLIVSHGLTLRVFLMRWFKWTVGQFDLLRNIEHGELIVMERGENGRFSLALHHTEAELRDFGLNDMMIQDQWWQAKARIGDLNEEWPTSSALFFTESAHLLEQAAKAPVE